MAKYECKICGYNGNTKEEMRKHVGDKHSSHLNKKSPEPKHTIRNIIVVILSILVTLSASYSNPQLSSYYSLGFLIGTFLGSIVFFLLLALLFEWISRKIRKDNTQKESAEKIKQKQKGHIYLGFLGGLVSGYIIVYALTYLLGYIIASAIYGAIFVFALNISRDEKDETLKWVGIGGLGLLLGLLINWIIRYADNKSNATKYTASILAWMIIMLIFFFIFVLVTRS